MAEEVNLYQLHSLHPKLRPYVKVLLTHEFGLLRELPEINGLQCGSIMRKNGGSYADRFQLRISYCKKPLIWHVLMNGDNVTKAPDFIMEDNFLASATPECIRSKVPSLVNWCPSDVYCLRNVVLELLELYKSFQICLLEMNPNLQRYLFEYDILLSMAGISKSDIEVYVPMRGLSVTFMIHLNVDFSRLPYALPDSKHLIVLIVEFKDNAKNTVQLVPRIELEDALGGPLELPDLSPDVSLLDYVPQLEKLLEKKVDQVIWQTHQRKMLYSYLVQFFEPSLINADNLNFRSVSFLLELADSFSVLNVSIPADYPDSIPTLQLLSWNKSTAARSLDYSSYLGNHKPSHEDIARSIFLLVKEMTIGEQKKSAPNMTSSE